MIPLLEHTGENAHRPTTAYDPGDNAEDTRACTGSVSLISRWWSSVVLPWLRESRRHAADDWKNTKWGSFDWRYHFTSWANFWICIMPSMTIYVMWIYLILSQTQDYFGYHGYGTACRPDGAFSPYDHAYEPWHISGFFQMTMSFGTLNFTQAKLIDIVWDLAVGRGGQFVLAWVSWRTFSNYLAIVITSNPITFSTFSIFFIETEPSVFSLVELVREFTRRHSPPSRLATWFIIYSVTLIVAWPTLASAMSGYTTLNDSYVTAENSVKFLFRDFQPVAYVIHDGHRLNMTKDHVVFAFDVENPSVSESRRDYLAPTGDHSVPSFKQSSSWYCNYTSPDLDGYIELSWTRSCVEQRATSDYVKIYGFSGGVNASTRWGNETLQSPSLNVSASYIDLDWNVYGSDIYSNETNMMYATADTAVRYNATYMDTHGQCQPVNEKYEWGFSFLQVFTVLTFLMVWNTGVWSLWFAAHGSLPLEGLSEVPRGWAALILLATSSAKMNLRSKPQNQQS